MNETLFISICIPAFQRPENLKRLLDSIEMQNFRSFEVVLTDDSPGEELRGLVENHPLKPKIRYFKNQKTLGSPENWNEAIRKTLADWIKIMHDDDWFSGPDSLRSFAEAIEGGKSDFYFSAFTRVLPDGRSERIRLRSSRLEALNRFPELLLAANRIGPPSVVIFKKDPSILFDHRMQWLVDIDFYIRFLKKHPSSGYLSRPLVQIGISESQVTQSSFGKQEIEIPERFLLAEKLEGAVNRNIHIYDSWWRFLRNLSVRDSGQIASAGYNGKIPPFITDMIKSQNKIPATLLRWGPSSKFFMFLNYLQNA